MIDPVPSTAASSAAPPPTVAEARAPIAAAASPAATSGSDATGPFHAAVFELLGAISRANQTGEAIPLAVGRAYNAVLGTLPAR